VVSHLRARPQRVDRVRTEYQWPLVSFRLFPPEGHFHFIDVDQVCRYHMDHTYIPFLVRMVSSLFSPLLSISLFLFWSRELPDGAP
jgi:hypothetical protein